MKATATYKLSICLCCMYVLANGECCSDEHGVDDDYPEPLSKIPPADNVTLGLSYSEHNEGCRLKIQDEYPGNVPDDYECDCENLGFSWSSCEGCGSPLGGDRCAATGWENENVV